MYFTQLKIYWCDISGDFHTSCKCIFTIMLLVAMMVIGDIHTNCNYIFHKGK